ncbi:MAG TPA: CmpA/NrtA family ABC transporter substrate-binding protein [Stellaceae bacterium]|jgi:ABC-type nitrate/sulfonate/bicarbonate transport system substrate-binding protein|nr:CmpA/NrtA family ABC transporter substrate-binding protein [Stellaceae bacterium]
MTSRSVFNIGIMRLTDAAPLIVARELGYFAAENIEVSLSVEASWANIADKLSYGLLDGAMLLPPLALALHLGLSGGGGPEPIVVPAALSLNGNTVTLAERWAGAILGGETAMPAIETARRFRSLIRERGEKPVLAVVHTFSTHNFLLRYWLAAGGIDPEREVSFTVVPPAKTAEALIDGKIDGFCAGAPWGEVAARGGYGRAVATSSGIWSHGTEKIFAVRQRVAEQDPERLFAVLRTLLHAAAYCDEPANAASIAGILADDRYLGLPHETIMSSLPGARSRSGSDVPVFFANAATFPWRSHAAWFLGQMRRWGYLDASVGTDAATVIFRPDLYARAAGAIGMPVPAASIKSEGWHGSDWQLPAKPGPIAMGPDAFMDGAVFDPAS